MNISQLQMITEYNASSTVSSIHNTILGSEYCSGYTDVLGNWNEGFYCPEYRSSKAIHCCGSKLFKYCCTTSVNATFIGHGINQQHEMLPFFLQTPVLIGIGCGLVSIFVILAIASCFFCSCCSICRNRIPYKNDTVVSSVVDAVQPSPISLRANGPSSMNRPSSPQEIMTHPCYFYEESSPPYTASTLNRHDILYSTSPGCSVMMIEEREPMKPHTSTVSSIPLDQSNQHNFMLSNDYNNRLMDGTNHCETIDNIDYQVGNHSGSCQQLQSTQQHHQNESNKYYSHDDENCQSVRSKEQHGQGQYQSFISSYDHYNIYNKTIGSPYSRTMNITSYSPVSNASKYSLTLPRSISQTAITNIDGNCLKSVSSISPPLRSILRGASNGKMDGDLYRYSGYDTKMETSVIGSPSNPGLSSVTAENQKLHGILKNKNNCGIIIDDGILSDSSYQDKYSSNRCTELDLDSRL